MAEKEKITPEAETEKAPAEEKKEKKAKKGLPVAALVAIIIAGVLVLAAIGVVAFGLIQDSSAKGAYAKGDYKTAYEASQSAFFMSAKDKITIEKAYVTNVLVKEGKYFAAAELINKSAMSADEKKALFASDNNLALCQVGQIVKFAKCDQDGKAETAEDLEWIVLKVVKVDGRAYATLLSKEIVGCSDGWNKISGNTLYSQSNLHDWCNTDFYQKLNIANDQELIEKIVPIQVKTGNDTVEAYVYAPSKAEIENALKGELAQYVATISTKTARSEGAISNSYYVRDPGAIVDKHQQAAGFDKEGKYITDLIADSGSTGARVCITVDLGSVA